MGLLPLVDRRNMALPLFRSTGRFGRRTSARGAGYSRDFLFFRPNGLRPGFM